MFPEFSEYTEKISMQHWNGSWKYAETCLEDFPKKYTVKKAWGWRRKAAQGEVQKPHTPFSCSAFQGTTCRKLSR